MTTLTEIYNGYYIFTDDYKIFNLKHDEELIAEFHFSTRRGAWMMTVYDAEVLLSDVTINKLLVSYMKELENKYI